MMTIKEIHPMQTNKVSLILTTNPKCHFPKMSTSKDIAIY